MSVRSAQAFFRRQERSLMTTECTVTRAGGEATYNPTTLAYTPATGTTPYTGPCLIRPLDVLQRIVQAGEEPVSLRTYRVKFPADTDVALDDTITVTVSDDPDLVGVTMRVIDVPLDEWQISRVVIAEQNLG